MWSLPLASRNPSTRRDLPTPASPWISTTWPRPWLLPSQARNSSPLSSWRPARGVEPPVRAAYCGIQLLHRLHDIEARPHRSLGLVLMGARVAEIDQDAVAHVLRDKAVVAPDRRAAAVLIRRDHIAQIFGVHAGGERGRSHQVAK